ncbi:hypothetical protein Lrub_0102 [Legionella rubrilucens]|uniref:Uncharacterized protein n=1 Tax=Legionella rubrilucens TaxID=458 RepID=A0A0W0Y763_9GAMM|nr:hypothetical protein [Legionella rubrilucens]KTD52470.1 hypothetical protein Lrub_0102 [Legionella rubrilucens]
MSTQYNKPRLLSMALTLAFLLPLSIAKSYAEGRTATPSQPLPAGPQLAFYFMLEQGYYPPPAYIYYGPKHRHRYYWTGWQPIYWRHGIRCQQRCLINQWNGRILQCERRCF